MNTKAAIFLTLGLLGGCSSDIKNVKSDFSFREGSQTGLMVIATRLIPNSECFRLANSLEMYYRKSDSAPEDGSEMIIVRNLFIKKDFENPDGYFHIQQLPAGRYRFSIILSAGTSLAPPMFANADFEIHPNQANYLGEVTISFDKCGALLSETKATLVFKDQSARDAVLFKERLPSVKQELVYQKVGTGVIKSVY